RVRLARARWELQKQNLQIRISRVLMISIMVNAMVLGFLSSSHAAAQLSGMSLICGPNGILSIPLADQKPDDRNLIDREHCITSCLAAMNGALGLVAEVPQIQLPALRFEPLKPQAVHALIPHSLERPRARGPPSI
ncbi:MAG TPA: hypothetical protein DCS30_11130, partial [Rhizobiales bacterium]|nr:hypothetical protein [Hyphomicrobiales bacterium]